MNRSWRKKLFYYVSCCSLIGCSIAPEHHVRRGAEPKYQDENVAFRNTYYFRVFDYCSNYNDANNQYESVVPEIKALYRFKMTGKSDTLFNKVRFESGTLRSSEIDPLGSEVIYDENIKRFRYASTGETQRAAGRAEAWQRYRDLLDEYTRLQSLNENSAVNSLQNQAHALEIALAKSIGRHDFSDSKPLSTRFDADLGASQTLLATLNKSEHEKLNSSVKGSVSQAIKDAKRVKTQSINASLNEVVQKFIKEERKKTIHEENGIGTKLKEVWVAAAGKPEGKLDNFKRGINNGIAENDKTLYSLSSEKESFKGELLNSIGDENSASAINIISEYISKYNTHYKNSANPHLSVSKIKEIIINSDKISENAIQSEKFTQVITPLLEEYSSSYVEKFDFKIEDKKLSKFMEDELKEAALLAVRSSVEKYIGTLKFSKVPQATLLALQTAITEQLQRATESASLSIPINTDQSSFVQNSGLENKKIVCNGEASEQKGFQILGPEGWRTFDPDERLIMAMHTSSKPITGVLKQLSQTVLKSHDARKQSILPLVEARLKLSEAQRSVERASNAATIDESDVCALVNQLHRQLGNSQELTAIPQSKPALDCKKEPNT